MTEEIKKEDIIVLDEVAEGSEDKIAVKYGFSVVVDINDKVILLPIGEERPDILQIAGLAQVLTYHAHKVFGEVFS